MIKEAVQDADRRMRSAIQSLQDDLAGIRTGRANPGLVEKLSVEYYGSPVPLIQLAIGPHCLRSIASSGVASMISKVMCVPCDAVATTT